MKKLKFTKMVASGNDFVVVEGQGHKLVKKICDRKYGVGADGLLVLEKSKRADIRMRIFNIDGSEAEMCGNGARCVVKYLGTFLAKGNRFTIETKAGIIESEVKSGLIKIKLTDPKDMKLNIPLKVCGRLIRVNFINTGVPHAVIFVQGLEKIDVFNLGRAIRNHKAFAPRGTNVNFVEVVSDHSIKVRTYERGVEDETLACGTGSVASALITAACCPFQGGFASLRSKLLTVKKINVATKSGEVLKVYFDRRIKGFHNVWLEGKAHIVYQGVWTEGGLR